MRPLQRCTPSRRHWIHSCVFLKGCIAGVAAYAQFGFHFLFFFSPFGLLAGQAPSVVMSKASLRRMPTTRRIWSLAAVGSASHMSPGEPAAEMSPKVMSGRLEVRLVCGRAVWIFQGK